MQPFIRDILYVVVSSAAAAGAVLLLRSRLIPLIAPRNRSQVAGIVLLLLQLVVGFFIASVDFGEARKAGIFNPGDLTAMRWLIPFSAVGIALQAVLLLNADSAVKEREELRAQAEFARRDRNFTTLVSEVFLTVVSRKRERLKSVGTKEQLWKAMQPRVQMAALIQACWAIFDSMAPDEVPPDYRLRVAYYRCVDGGLEPAFAWNGNSSDCVPPRDEATKLRFRFDHPEGCLAVAAARDGGIYRVADTAEAAAKRSHPFVFFDEKERKTLKSIAALPVKLEGDPSPHGVLVVDTNLEGLFNQEDRRQELALLVVVENLAHRLHLEERLGKLMGGF